MNSKLIPVYFNRFVELYDLVYCTDYSEHIKGTFVNDSSSNKIYLNIFHDYPNPRGKGSFDEDILNPFKELVEKKDYFNFKLFYCEYS